MVITENPREHIWIIVKTLLYLKLPVQLAVCCHKGYNTFAMDTFFDKIGEILKSFDSLLDDVFQKDSKRGADYQNAWEELEEYLKTGKEGKETGSAEDWFSRKKNSYENSYENSHQTHPSSSSTLAQDYANLDLPNDAPFEEVRKAYKQQMKKYHPDQFVNDPEKSELATEITKKINESYQNIKKSNSR